MKEKNIIDWDVIGLIVDTEAELTCLYREAKKAQSSPSYITYCEAEKRFSTALTFANHIFKNYASFYINGDEIVGQSITK